jgi:uncharacterized protein involved in type VI secretion and phage assembly
MREVQGVVHGFIKDTKDPDKLGRVKLRLPMLDPDYESGWVPIASPMSGDSRGFFFSPEVDDEVVVAFDNGHIDHPYVIGFLYNGSQKPPETELKNRVILTPGGNTLRFEDKDGAKKIVLKTSAGFLLEMDEQAKKITLSDAGSEVMTFTAQDGKIKIEAGMKVVINAPAIELEEGATHPVVFGDSLVNYLDNTLKIALDTHLHVGQLALGILPVTPMKPAVPVPPATSAINSLKVKTG